MGDKLKDRLQECSDRKIPQHLHGLMPMGDVKLSKENVDVLIVRLRDYIVFYGVVLSIGKDDDQVQDLSSEMAEADKPLREVVLTSDHLLFWVYAGYREAIHRYRPGSLKKQQYEPPEYLRGWWSTAELISAY
jgi:hypothetical protein